jgi:hypothetical protein
VHRRARGPVLRIAVVANVAPVWVPEKPSWLFPESTLQVAVPAADAVEIQDPMTRADRIILTGQRPWAFTPLD